MKTKSGNDVPTGKIKAVEELKNLLQSKKTLLIASIKNLPAAQFQTIGKKLRGKAIVKVPKKNFIYRALDGLKSEHVEELKKQITDGCAILFSDEDSYDLALELINKKTPAKAKVGQIANFDISVSEGPTGLVPGPAISELGALGIQIQIDKGKINIKESKIIAKEGAKISQAASDIMAKLDILPFESGYIPLSAYDIKSGKLYLNIEIDKKKTVEELKNAFGKSLSFAVGIGYTTEDTVKVMIQTAGSHEAKMIRVINGEPEEVAVLSGEGEENEAPMEEKKEEKKADASAGLASLFG